MSENSKPTVTEVQNTLNGFDEIAIEKAFGAEYDDLNGRNTLRALIFTMKRRDGLDDIKARKAALEVPMDQLVGHFADDANEVDEDEPETDAGKTGAPGPAAG
jgi:hypothetical protein